MKNNANYKASTDRQMRIFNVGDYVMVRLRPEGFPSEVVKKLHTRTVGLFKSARRLIQLFIWWTSHQIFVVVASLMLLI